TEPLGVAHGRAADVIVEVGVDVAALVEPSGESLRDGPQPPAPVAPGVRVARRVRAVEADVRPVGRAHPGMAGQQIVDAERGPVPGQHVEHLVVQPRLVAHLHRPAHVARRDLEERVEPGRVASPVRRQLHEVRTEGVPEQLDALEVAGEPLIRVAQLLAVGPVAADLHRVAEPRRRLVPPPLDLRGRWQPVEGVLELHGVAAPGAVREPRALRRVRRVDGAGPVAVGPAGAPDPSRAATRPHRGRSTVWPSSVVIAAPCRKIVMSPSTDTLSTTSACVDSDFAAAVRAPSCWLSLLATTAPYAMRLASRSTTVAPSSAASRASVCSSRSSASIRWCSRVSVRIASRSISSRRSKRSLSGTTPSSCSASETMAMIAPWRCPEIMSAACT